MLANSWGGRSHVTSRCIYFLLKSWFFANAIIYGNVSLFLKRPFSWSQGSTIMENIQNLRSWKHPPFFSRSRIPGGEGTNASGAPLFTTWKKTNADSHGGPDFFFDAWIVLVFSLSQLWHPKAKFEASDVGSSQNNRHQKTHPEKIRLPKCYLLY